MFKRLDLTPVAQQARVGKGNSSVRLSKAGVILQDKVIQKHSPWLRILSHCLKPKRQHLHLLLMVSEVKVISRTSIQEHKPATRCSTTCLSDVKAIFSTSNSQYRPALAKQHRLTTAGDVTLVVLGSHQLNGSLFKGIIRFLITAKYFKLPKLEKKKPKPKRPPNEFTN